MEASRGVQTALGRLRTIARSTCGFSLDQVDDNALTFKLEAHVRRAGNLWNYIQVIESDPHERQLFVEALCTHETRFFRHEAHFKYLLGTFLPQLKAEMDKGAREKRVRVWSVACSSGEEPVSIAVTLGEVFGSDVECSVLATDISTSVLERARQLRFPIESSKSIPDDLLRRHFLRGVGAEAGFLRPSARVRDMLRFEAVNLMDAAAAFSQSYELVFCRNVLIYFDEANRSRITSRLLSVLTPDGILVTGPSEGVARSSDEIHMLSPHIYRKRSKK